MPTARLPRFPIRVIGPRELDAAQAAGETVVWTVSKAEEDWQRDLSPFHLGPVPVYGGRQSRSMENAWQYAKVYATHAQADGTPTAEYWDWAEAGWKRPAVRYPMGKGAKPLYCLWDGERLDYLTARRKVYFPVYRDAVKLTEGFRRLQELHVKGPVTLFDFDGYCHQTRNMTLAQVAAFTSRPMGHAFVLKAMLLHGVDVTPEDLATLEDPPRSSAEQLGLF